MSQHDGLPVAGYRSQTQAAVDTVNENKLIEERVIRRIEQTTAIVGIDPDRRNLALARTYIEIGFMYLNRAVFKPERVKLPED